jgi:hypothetical protein
VAGCRRISTQIARFRDHYRNSANAAKFRQSDTKIWGPSVVNSVTNKLQYLMVADFHKHPCKNEEFKFRKRFMIFLKIKEAFTVKMKMIFVYHHFRLHQTPKNTKNIFQKTTGT